MRLSLAALTFAVTLAVTLAAAAAAVPALAQRSAPRPPTCRRALQQYRDPRAVPAPYVTVDVPRDGGDRLDAAARLGATGYVLAAIPDSLLSTEERDALGPRAATARVFRTVALFVPADSARAYATCRGRIIRSY